MKRRAVRAIAGLDGTGRAGFAVVDVANPAEVAGRGKAGINEVLVPQKLESQIQQHVRDYICNALDRLLSENDIALLKRDYNRNWSEPGWPDLASDEQKKIYVDYVQAVYGILRYIRAKYSEIEIEGCAGGEGRVDLGMMGCIDQFWISDETDPFSLTIQESSVTLYSCHHDGLGHGLS